MHRLNLSSGHLPELTRFPLPRLAEQISQAGPVSFTCVLLHLWLSIDDKLYVRFVANVALIENRKRHVEELPVAVFRQERLLPGTKQKAFERIARIKSVPAAEAMVEYLSVTEST